MPLPLRRPAGPSPSRRLAHAPATTYLVYNQVPSREAIRRKVLEFSAALAAAAAAGAAGGLTEAEAAEGGPLDGLLDRVAGGVAPQADLAPPLAVLSKLLSWPPAQLFPALDLARLLVLDAAASERLAAAAGPLSTEGPPGSLGRALAWACEPPLLPANQQTAVRLACNAFVHQPLRGWALAQGAAVLELFSGFAAAPGRAVQQGVATLLLNYAIALPPGSSQQLTGRVRALQP